MARIIELFPGIDGKTRVAKVKTKLGHIVRPLQRLVPLELNAGQTDTMSKPEEIQNSIKLHQEQHKKPVKLKKSTIIDDKKEIITKSGRLVKSPLRFRFN